MHYQLIMYFSRSYFSIYNPITLKRAPYRYRKFGYFSCAWYLVKYFVNKRVDPNVAFHGRERQHDIAYRFILTSPDASDAWRLIEPARFRRGRQSGASIS